MTFRRVWAVLATAGALALTPAAQAAATARVSVSRAKVGAAVPAGFVGLANEYSDIEKELGTNPSQPDVPFEQIVRNLAPYGGLVLRIGGDTTDWTWWPVSGKRQPGWVRYTLTPTWAAVVQKLAEDLNAHLILGINMEADSKVVAGTEVHQLSAALGASVPVTYELGNEPELYAKFPFYRFPAYHQATGAPLTGRPKGYSYADITADWRRLASALPRIPLAGPGYSSTKALPYLAQFLRHAKQLSVLTVHNYPLKSPRCGGVQLSESQLFQLAALKREASAMVPWSRLAHRFGVSVRVDEVNAVTCGGLPNFSNTLGPALWALNILPRYLESGIQGVNVESRPFTAQNLVQPVDTPTGWRVQVQPEYYGLLAFAQLTPPGSRLLRMSATPTGLLAWAVATPTQGTAVALTNITDRATKVSLHIAGSGAPASVKILRAARGGLSATGGISLGGQRISAATGQLTGTPVTTTIPVIDGSYKVRVPAASAAIVTIGQS